LSASCALQEGVDEFLRLYLLSGRVPLVAIGDFNLAGALTMSKSGIAARSDERPGPR
jgi:hypothetical protein